MYKTNELLKLRIELMLSTFLRYNDLQLELKNTNIN